MKYLKIECYCGVDDWFNWIPSFKTSITGKHLNVKFVILWWYLSTSFVITADED